MHAPRQPVVAARRDDGSWRLASPAPGMFRPAISVGVRLAPDDAVGTLDVLGRTLVLVVPPAVSGYASTLVDVARGNLFEARHVDFGDGLLALHASPLGGGELPAVHPAPDTATSLTGPVFRAPTSGRFYGRSAPDKPAFVQVGDELARGATVCLLEVMKTFHRVTYAGERARVGAVLVADGDDVTAGDPLLALDPV